MYYFNLGDGWSVATQDPSDIQLEFSLLVLPLFIIIYSLCVNLNCALPPNLFFCVGQPVFLSYLSVYCSYREDKEEEHGANKNTTITSFFKNVSSNKRLKTKHTFFTVRNLAASELL
jgi:hypothetical protein